MNRPARVLVAEDEGIIAAHLHASLRRIGHEVCGVAASGVEAVALAEGASPDLILMDIGMGGALDGIGAAAEILARRGPPVIFLTAHADAATLARAEAAEPVGYVTRPFDELHLGAGIAIGLHQHEVRRRLEASEAAAREAKDRLRMMATRYATILRTASDGIHVTDPTGKVLDVNDAFCRMLGYSHDELLALRVIAWDTEVPEEELLQHLRQLAGGHSETFDRRHRRKDGTLRDVEISGCGVVVEGAPLIYMSVRDVTDRKRAERERLEIERRRMLAQKNESLGVMAAGIAHNLNNILQTVLGNIQLAREEAPPGTTELLQDAAEAAKQAAKIGQAMLSYVGQAGRARAPQDVAGEIDRLVPIFRSMMPGSVRFEVSLAWDTPWCTVDPGDFRQLVQAVVTNAWEATAARGGRVSITTKLERGVDAQPPRDSDMVVIEIKDDGEGMDQATMDRMYDPFFSTKFTGRGLGLCAAKGIVQAAGGRITSESTRGLGTTITVRLPAISAESRAGSLRVPSSEPASSPRPATPRPGGARYVLVVDDDPAVRLATQRLLQRIGHEVLFANDGASAIASVEAHGPHISCVLLDVSMPGGDGWTVLAEVRRRRPGLHVIIASGYDVAVLRAEPRDVRPDAWLQKPYSLRALRESLPQPRGDDDA